MARSARSRRPTDLYDLFRLVEVFDQHGQLRDQLTTAPSGLGCLVADVIATEILTNPARAAQQMGAASLTGPPSSDRISDVLEPFVDELRSSP